MVLHKWIGVVLALNLMATSVAQLDPFTRHDKNCQKGLKKAEKAFDKGQIIYFTSWEIYSSGYFDIGDGPARYENALQVLLNENGIDHGVGIIHKPKHRNQIKCAKYFMDSIISLKYGEGFIATLRERADSLFASKYRTTVYSEYDVDERPKLDIEVPNSERGLASLAYIEHEKPLLFNKLNIPDTLFHYADITRNEASNLDITIELIVDTLGHMSDIKVSGRTLAGLELSEEELAKVCKTVAEHVALVDIWKPGVLLGRNVTSTASLKLYLYYGEE